MKVKGVGAFELHVEKIVLGAVSVVFLLVVSAQLLLEPNQITVGQDKRAPGKAYEPVLTKAQQVQAAMEPRDQWDKPKLAEGNLVEEFRAAQSAPVAPRSSAVAFGEGIRMEHVMVDAPVGDAATFAEVAVPAPVGPVGDSYWAALDPGQVMAYPALAQLVPQAQPYDKAFVTIEATFDGTALTRSLQADPDGKEGPVRPIPTTWYRDSTEIVAVRLEREEQVSTGEWTNLTEVPPPPGMVDLIAENASIQDQADMLVFVSDARRSAEDIQRPEFYRTIAGYEWLPPRDSLRVYGGGELPAAVQRDFLRMGKALDELTRTEDALLDARDGAGRPPPGRGGGEIAPPPARDRPVLTPAQQRIATLENRIKALKNEIAALEASIRTAGFDPETRQPLPPPPAAESLRPLMSDPQVRVWAHDLTAEPGKAYRYRLKVGINNPMYGRVAGLTPAQAGLAKSPVAWSAPSEWTEVNVQGRELWFVAGASEGDNLGGSARASFELYRMFYGFYRRGSASLEPGDLLESDVKLPHQNLLPIFDLEKLKPGAGALPGGIPPPPPVPTGRPGQDGIIIEVPPPPPPPPGAALPPGAAPTADQPPPLPPGAKPWVEPIRVVFDVMLLDVGRAPIAESTGLGTPRAPAQANLRVADGRVVARIPDEDRNLAARLRAEESAKRGETQGAPPPPQAEEVQRPGPRRRPERQPLGEGGGGGGGG